MDEGGGIAFFHKSVTLSEEIAQGGMIMLNVFAGKLVVVARNLVEAKEKCRLEVQFKHMGGSVTDFECELEECELFYKTGERYYNLAFTALIDYFLPFTTPYGSTVFPDGREILELRDRLEKIPLDWRQLSN